VHFADHDVHSRSPVDLRANLDGSAAGGSSILPRMTLRSTALLLAIVALTSGCGLKGPLYLPEEREQPAATQTDTNETERKSRSGSSAGTQAATGSETTPERDDR